MTDKVLSTLSALKVLAYGGPVAVAFTAGGGAVLAVALYGRGGEHGDALVVLGAVGVVLGFVEWALARRFAAHEKVEKMQYERVANIADSAAQSITEMTRATRENTVVMEGFRAELRKVSDEVVQLGKRVQAIEDRYMRPAMLYPSARPPGDE